MADEYDPAEPPTYDAAADEGNYDATEHDNFSGQRDDGNDEDDDYDPSNMNYGADTVDSTPAQSTPQTPAQSDPTASRPQTKVAGFIVESSDDEQDTSAPPAPSQVNGDAGAHSGLGAVAQSEAQDVSLNSAPQVDQAAESSSLNGFTVSVPASTTLTVAPDITVSTPAPASASEGKTTSAVPSVQATPQPVQQSIAPTPQAPAEKAKAPAVQIPPARLPHDKVGQLEDRIKDDPKGDTDAWYELITHYASKEQYDNVRSVFARFQQVFPTAEKLWLDRIKFETGLEERGKVSELIAQALRQPTIALMKIYVETARRNLPTIGEFREKHQNELILVFKHALDNVGIDPDAGELWREYIDFLRGSLPVDRPWEELQKFDLLRAAYQRATQIPHSELVKLWKEYEALEMSINKQTGRKNIQEHSPNYMQARTARMQLEQKLNRLDRSSLPRLPPIYGCAGEDEFGEQVERWRAWIEWERDEDPLAHKATNEGEWRNRVVYAYRQATMSLCFYPEIWFEAASWCFSTGIEETIADGEDFLNRGMAINPESVLLAMMKADRVESSLESGNTDEVLIRNGDRLNKPYEDVHAALYSLRNKTTDKDKVAIAQIQAHFASLPPEDEPTSAQEEDDEDEAAEKPKTRAEQMKAQIDAVKQASAAHLDVLKRTISYVWVAKMRAFRRVQGQGQPPKRNADPSKLIKGFRGVFGEARPRGPLSSDVYIASALMEWQCYKDGSAVKIFERGMKLFPTDDAFILEYIKHLISIGDITNARVVFESTIPKIMATADITPEQKQLRCRPLMGYMHDFESKYGDLAQIHKIEKRMAEIYPEEPEIARFAHRLELPTFDAINVQLMLSPSQAQPKPVQSLPPGAAAQHIMGSQLANSIEGPSSPQTGGPEILLGPNGPYVASPKRPLDSGDDDGPSRKFLRGDSPIKGAAGVRLAATTSGFGSGGAGKGGFATKTFVPLHGPSASVSAVPPPGLPPMPVGPPPLPITVLAVLASLPPSHTWYGPRLDATKLLPYLQTTKIEDVRHSMQSGTLRLTKRQS